MSKEKEVAFSEALAKAQTPQEIDEAIALLPDNPKYSTTEQPTTLADLILALETEKTTDG